MDSTVEVVIKKKRGRKPKEKKEVEVKIPKKRGRKPTGKIISMKTSELSTLQNDENCIIAHIPLSSKTIEKIENKYKDLKIGSYPYFNPRGFGTSIVLRSENKKIIENASDEIIIEIKKLGGEGKIIY